MGARRPTRAVVAVALSLLVLLLPAVPAASGTGGFHVVGGAPAPEGAWPSTVALVRASDSDPVTGQVCVGTAIAEDLVLTAAHCFHTVGGSLSRQASDVRVVAGRTDLSAAGGVEAHGVDLFVHPGYEAGRHRQDVAVLRVDRPLGVPAQRLAEAGAPLPAAGDVVVTLGWGRTGESAEQGSARTNLLHEAHVEVADEAVCAAALQGTPDVDVHLCAGGRGTPEAPQPDACRGDSGGPLMLPVEGGAAIQVGITAFGPPTCGVEDPGVYARVDVARRFIDDVVAGRVAPALPSGSVAAGEEPSRIASAGDVTTPVGQAVAMSRAVFQDRAATLAVLARDDAFPDALAGSSLVFGGGPLLFSGSGGPLDRRTREELRRVLQPGATVYLLGGPAALPVAVEADLQRDGFVPRRLAGGAREATAAAIADEVVATQGQGSRPPFGTVVLATSQSWPDAVLAGQLTAWWGYPILLTPPTRLAPEAADALARYDVERLIIVGGPAALSVEVTRQAVMAAGAPETVTVAGPTRVETALQMAAFQRAELRRAGQRPPDAVVAVNVRRDDGYAHILSAAPLLSATAGVLVPVESVDGSQVPRGVERSICGYGGMAIGAGGRDVIADDVLAAVARAIAQVAC